MITAIELTQLTVAVSVLFVWTFRLDNVAKEFKQFNLSNTVRSIVGTSKICLATLLIVGIWHAELVLYASLFMGAFMLAAQFFHWKVKNPVIKKVPSFVFLVLCAWIASNAYSPTP
jgi:uncharacterized membrane protein YiaA